jgi:hypothetical protein
MPSLAAFTCEDGSLHTVDLDQQVGLNADQESFLAPFVCFKEMSFPMHSF